MIDAEHLKTQIAHLERQDREAREHLLRIDGALQVSRHLLLTGTLKQRLLREKLRTDHARATEAAALASASEAEARAADLEAQAVAARAEAESLAAK